MTADHIPRRCHVPGLSSHLTYDLSRRHSATRLGGCLVGLLVGHELLQCGSPSNAQAVEGRLTSICSWVSTWGGAVTPPYVSCGSGRCSNEESWQGWGRVTSTHASPMVARPWWCHGGPAVRALRQHRSRAVVGAGTGGEDNARCLTIPLLAPTPRTTHLQHQLRLEQLHDACKRGSDPRKPQQISSQSQQVSFLISLTRRPRVIDSQVSQGPSRCRHAGMSTVATQWSVTVANRPLPQAVRQRGNGGHTVAHLAR